MVMMTLVMLIMVVIMTMNDEEFTQVMVQAVGKDGERLLLLVARALGLQSR